MWGDDGGGGKVEGDRYVDVEGGARVGRDKDGAVGG